MNFIHEVEYVFEYEGAEYREHYYRDSIEGRRYLKQPGGPFLPLNVKASGNEFSMVKPNLIGVKEINSTDTLLVYELQDINKISVIKSSKYPGGVIFSRNSDPIFDKVFDLGENA